MKFPEIREIETKDLVLRKIRRDDVSQYFQRSESREKGS